MKKRNWGIRILVLFIFVSFCPATLAQTIQTSDAVSAIEVSLNNYRESTGLANIALDAVLCNMAQTLAKEKDGYTGKTALRPDGSSRFSIFEQHGYDLKTQEIGIAALTTYGHLLSADDLIYHLIGSPSCNGHFKSDYSRFGAGIYYSATDNAVHYVILFSEGKRSSDTNIVPAEIFIPLKSVRMNKAIKKLYKGSRLYDPSEIENLRTTSQTAIYKRESTSSSKLTTLPRLAKLDVLSVKRDKEGNVTWYQVHNGNIIGYVQGKHAIMDDIVGSFSKTVVLLKAPRVDAEQLKVVSPNSQVSAIYDANGYYRVEVSENNKTLYGYLSIDVLRDMFVVNWEYSNL